MTYILAMIVGKTSCLQVPQSDQAVLLLLVRSRRGTPPQLPREGGVGFLQTMLHCWTLQALSCFPLPAPHCPSLSYPEPLCSCVELPETLGQEHICLQQGRREGEDSEQCTLGSGKRTSALSTEVRMRTEQQSQLSVMACRVDVCSQ